MDWEKDLESYPENFQKLVKEKLGVQDEPDRQEPVVLYKSGIEPINTAEHIAELVDRLTPKPPKARRFEPFVAGIAFTVLVGGIIVIVLTLLGMGG